MYTIEKGFGTEGNESEYFANLIIADNAEEIKQTERHYAIAPNCPEIEERIETDDGAWEKKIYIFSDAGDGIIFYAKAEEERKRGLRT